MKMDALIIKKRPLELILDGKKTWELRGSACRKRGKIALIESKSGLVVGTAEIVDCRGPLTLKEFNQNLDKSQASPVKSSNDFYYKRTHAWVLKNVQRFKKPIPYKHKQGCVIWHPVEI